MGVDPLKGPPKETAYSARDKEVLSAPGMMHKLTTNTMSSTQVQDMLGNSPLLQKIPVSEFSNGNNELINQTLTHGMTSNFQMGLGAEYLQRQKESLAQTAEFQNQEEHGHLSNGDVIDPDLIESQHDQVEQIDLDRIENQDNKMTQKLIEEENLDGSHLESSRHGLTGKLAGESVVDLDHVENLEDDMVQKNQKTGLTGSEVIKKQTEVDLRNVEQSMEHNPVVNREVEMLDNLVNDPMLDVDSSLTKLETKPIDQTVQKGNLVSDSQGGNLVTDSQGGNLTTLQESDPKLHTVNETLVMPNGKLMNKPLVTPQDKNAKVGGLTQSQESEILQDSSGGKLTVIKEPTLIVEDPTLIEQQNSGNLTDSQLLDSPQLLENDLSNIQDHDDTVLTTHQKELIEQDKLISQQEDFLDQQILSQQSGLSPEKIDQTRTQQAHIEEISKNQKLTEQEMDTQLRTPIDSFDNDPKDTMRTATETLKGKIEHMDQELGILEQDDDIADINIKELVNTPEGLQELREQLDSPKVQNDPTLKQKILDYMIMSDNRKKAGLQFEKNSSLIKKFGHKYSKFQKHKLVPKYNTRSNPDEEFYGIPKRKVNRIDGNIVGLKRLQVPDDLRNHLGRRRKRFFYKKHLMV